MHRWPRHSTAQHSITAMQRNSSSNVILIHCTYSTAQQQQPHTFAASQQGGCPAGGKKVVGVWCRGTAFAHTHRHQHCAAHPARQAKPVVHKHKESTRTHVSWYQNRTTGGRGVAHATACLVLCGALQPPKTPKPWHAMPYLPRQGISCMQDLGRRLQGVHQRTTVVSGGICTTSIR